MMFECSQERSPLSGLSVGLASLQEWSPLL